MIDPIGEMEERLKALESRVRVLEKELAFADDQTGKVEALLEPHVEWKPVDDETARLLRSKERLGGGG